MKGLIYTGDPLTGHPALRDAPARDLTPFDIDRVAFIRKQPPHAVRVALLASRIYREPPKGSTTQETSDE